MNNEYEIRGDVTAIFLRRKDGAILETTIDTYDLPKVKELQGKWYAFWDRGAKSFYVYGNLPKINGKKKNVKLHRWIMNPKDNFVVDHINHNTLNNRRENLRIVTNSENMQNRKGAQRNNKTSGLRGVSWHKRDKVWRAYIKLNGKSMHLGYFNSIDQANETVMEARKKLMPYSQEEVQLASLLLKN